nr:hypothetical protein [Streptomyces sp. RPA4-2]
MAGIIDEVCPVGASPFLTHGQVIEAMVSNRLTSAAPLVRMGDRVHTGVVEEGLGVDPGLLNGDHPAWALDAIAPELQRIAGTVEAGAIAEFGIDVGRLHWDVISMSAHSACPTEGEDANYPVMKYGHPNDRRGTSSRSKRGIRRPSIPGHARVFGGGPGAPTYRDDMAAHGRNHTAPHPGRHLGQRSGTSWPVYRPGTTRPGNCRLRSSRGAAVRRASRNRRYPGPLRAACGATVAGHDTAVGIATVSSGPSEGPDPAVGASRRAAFSGSPTLRDITGTPGPCSSGVFTF